MKVKMAATAAGPEFIYQAGKVVDAPEEHAKAWLADGYAQPPATADKDMKGSPPMANHPDTGKAQAKADPAPSRAK
jgi:hypothetical protein